MNSITSKELSKMEYAVLPWNMDGKYLAADVVRKFSNEGLARMYVSNMHARDTRRTLTVRAANVLS
jgi:hypothetical protein